jgi:hypothetical protein
MHSTLWDLEETKAGERLNAVKPCVHHNEGA